MYQLNEPLTFIVPLSFEAHGLADRFRRQQSSTQKAKQVYLNTLAVYAVDLYLRCLGIETEVDKSDSRNPLNLKFMDVADLYLKSIGKLECRPVLPEATILQIPVEVKEDRIGYVAVQFDRSLKQATLLGFTPTPVAELPLSQLREMADFPEYLHQLRQPSRSAVNLRRWLESIKTGWQNLEAYSSQGELIPNFIEAGWHEIEAFFGPEELTPAFRSPDELMTASSDRSTFIERGKLIRLATQVTTQTIVLIVTLNPRSEDDTNIIVEVRPQSGQLYLPEMLQVKILDENRTAAMQATASSTNQNIQFDFNAAPTERFSVQMVLGETSVIEDFQI
ncbi:MAG: DUF1822 family protein [Cyanosarcina radialis HA8281-LM2]|jgi:hypothetical protein|nr:DUF1822 family protein [Cyanosarcina radialis HA8281-LM2]